MATDATDIAGAVYAARPEAPVSAAVALHAGGVLRGHGLGARPLEIDQAADAFEAAEAALRRGDLVEYAEKIEEAEQAVADAVELLSQSAGTGADV